MKTVEHLDDATLEWAAQQIEESDLFDIGGIAARRKRDREDAALRSRTRIELKRELAEFLRAFKSRRDLDAIEILRRVVSDAARAGPAGVWLRDAWPLAWKGWIDIYAVVRCNSNSLPPETRYTVSLTERGREILTATEGPDNGPDNPALQASPDARSVSKRQGLSTD